MKIVQIAPVWYTISSRENGNIGSVIHLLTEGLIARENNVILFASGDSDTHADLRSVFDKSPCEQIEQFFPDLLHVSNAYKNTDGSDIIHDHSGMIGPAIGSMAKIPVLHTLYGPATNNAKRLYISLNHGIFFNAISEYQKKCFGDLNFIDTIYNAIDTEDYPFMEDKEDYLLFLGQMNSQKGAHLAIEVAKRLNMELKLVTKIEKPQEKKFFSEYIEPNMTNKCEIIGEISHEEKTKIYAKAKCTLYPTQQPEPFDLSMIESMACGTPVIAIKEGAAPEIIFEGETGYLILNDIDEMCNAVKKIDKIYPWKCRRHVVENFSVEIMVHKYEKAYEQILNKYIANSSFDRLKRI